MMQRLADIDGDIRLPTYSELCGPLLAKNVENLKKELQPLMRAEEKEVRLQRRDLHRQE